MKPKVLLIVHDIYKEDNLFPLGPGYVASSLRNSGHDMPQKNKF